MEQHQDKELTVGQKRYRARRDRAKAFKRPVVMMDPATGHPLTLPTKDLSLNASVPAIIEHVNKLQGVVLAQASVIAEYRTFFMNERKKRDVDVDVVERLAACGANQTMIGEVLGFNWHAVSRNRPDLEEAFKVGRAALKCALAGEQIQTAFGKYGAQAASLMQIFLGKQLLDQKPDSALTVNVGVVTGDGSSDLRKKIAEEKRKHDEAAQAAFVDATVVDCVDVVAVDFSEKSATGT